MYKRSPDNFWGRSGLWSFYRYLFADRNLLQVFIALPAAAWIFWRSGFWAQRIDPQAGALSVDMLLPVALVVVVVLVLSVVSRVLSGLNNRQFPDNAIKGCDNSMVLYLVYFCSGVLLTGLIMGAVLAVR